MAEPVIDERMRAYYDRRALEYDDWWTGARLYAERERPGWDDEVAQLIDTLRALPAKRTLDVACGTGFLTRHLSGEITAIDQSARMVAVASERLPHATVLQGEAVPLPFADQTFDRIVTGHFYGHLDPDEAAAFRAEARRVAGELVVVDSALRPAVSPEEMQTRLLTDGSRHQVFKRYFEPHALAAELGGETEVLHAGTWFVVVRSRSVTPR